jgi:hypothetical protein
LRGVGDNGKEGKGGRGKGGKGSRGERGWGDRAKKAKKAKNFLSAAFNQNVDRADPFLISGYDRHSRPYLFKGFVFLPIFLVFLKDTIFRSRIVLSFSRGP